MRTKKELASNNKKRIASYVESLDEEDFEEDGFIEGDINIGTPIASFNFGANVDLQNYIESTKQQPTINKSNIGLIPDDQVYRTTPRGLTPPIDGEHFIVKRSYQLRPSTARKLNELKAKHPDINVYFNTIIDAAILHYHNYILYEDGPF